MFYPATSALAFFLVILAMFMWGSWPFIRSLCLANSPSFSQLYQIAQLSISLLACISLGNTQYNSNHLADFDNQVWAADVQHPGSSAKILCLLVGGIFNSQADFLCAAACTVLPFGVAFPIYGGFGLTLGTVLNYIILGRPGNAALLFSGLVFALMAITQLALSDSVDNKKKKKLSTPHLDEEVRPPLSILVEKEKESSKKEQISPLWGNDSEFIEEGVVDTKAPVHSIKDHSSPIEAPLETKPNTRNWVYICVFAGALTGMWSPLSTLGTSGEGAVLNPYSALFLFQCGQTLGAPIYLSYSSYLFKRNEKSPSFEYPHILFLELFELPTETVLYGLACGGVVGFGFTMYFIASSVVSPAISFATAACCPLFTILLGILFGKQLSGASRLKTALLFGAVCFYIIAIVLIAASK